MNFLEIEGMSLNIAEIDAGPTFIVEWKHSRTLGKT